MSTNEDRFPYFNLGLMTGKLAFSSLFDDDYSFVCLCSHLSSLNYGLLSFLFKRE